MTIEQCLAYYGTPTKLAQALGIRLPSVLGWVDHPPPLRQIQLERLTKGKLKAEPSVWRAAK